jgi:hypothetical protein
MSHENMIAWRNVAIIPCIVAVAWLLNILLCREWVKRDVIARGLRPVRVRWKPFTLWPIYGPAFRVLYEDATGSIHEVLYGVCAWWRVRWRDDRVVAATEAV